MKKILLTSLFMLATLAWAAAQQPSDTTPGSSGQATSPSSQAGANQSQPPTAGTAGQDAGASGAQGGMMSPTVTEGCLGGSNPNYTITAASGTTYKLNIPPNADTSKLSAHVGESVNVAGNVNSGGSPSIDVRGIGRGTGTCPAGASKGGVQPPKQ
jgi:hypothetical protein